ncbi:MucR family transcriptional regulator [Rubrimonas cliftonensis]|uniref:Transcriptional regulator, MucR family n=1 Tax=Rubrimonas cliftonensis TaxID=89524 RepID=A0A1H4DXH5_9RHOB|nr:MucR family transcriptional regulator [Rubrimonas cliftonensis]SEA77484.1 transcriptional regulator, MucR family [Rubrimonas cliftonensis]
MSNEQASTSELLALTSQIVASHVSNNSVGMADLPQLIEQVYGALHGLIAPPQEPKEELRPAVPVKKSVTDDYIICLEDGKKMKMLKRHLSTAYGMTPEQYREKWGLPADYPMVAPTYSLKRQRLAKENGLGRNRGKA